MDWKNVTNVPKLYDENGEVKSGANKVNSPVISNSYQFSVTMKGFPRGEMVRGVIFEKMIKQVKWVYSEEVSVTNK